MWLAGSKNLTVNEICKKDDNDDWQTPESFFQLLSNSLGKYTIDRFPDNRNAKAKNSVLSKVKPVYSGHLWLLKNCPA